MGTNPGSASYSKRKAKRAVALADAAGVPAGAGALTTATDAFTRSTDANRDPNQPDLTNILNLQRRYDGAADLYDTNMARQYNSSLSRNIFQIRDLRTRSTTDVSNISVRLRSSVADLERLVPKAQDLLTSGKPLSDLRRSRLNKAFEIINTKLPIMRTNIQRAETELRIRGF